MSARRTGAAGVRSISGVLGHVFERLVAAYGYQGWWPVVTKAGRLGRDSEGYRTAGTDSRSFQTPRPDERLEIVLGAVLTQNTSWENAKQALLALANAGLMDCAEILSSDHDTLAAAVRPSGYFNQKARKIRNVIGFLAAGGYLGTGGSAPRGGLRSPPRKELLDVWGIGPETADAILLYAFGVPVFVVDAYTNRLLSRFGYMTGKAPYAAVQGMFHAELEPDAAGWGEFHALIVHHAKTHCAVRPQCAGCPLWDPCRFRRAHSPES